MKQTYGNINIYRSPKKQVIKINLEEGFNSEEIEQKIKAYRSESGYSLVEVELNPETIGIDYKGPIVKDKDLEELLINLGGIDVRLQEAGKSCVLQILSEYVTINQLFDPRFLGWLNGAVAQFFESKV